jgi:uncharacterized membrane protein (Fun14 family)
MTSVEKSEKARRSDPRQNFWKHIGLMPLWHKAIVIVAGVLALAGLAGHLYARSGGDAQVQVVKTTATPGAQTPASAKNAVKSSGENKDQVESKQPIGSISQIAPAAMAVGFGILVGFALGWFMRTFFTSLAVLTMSTIAGFWILSYFGVLHPETWNPEAFKGKSAEAANWVFVYARQAKEIAFGNLLCTSATAFAACLGFRRF